MCDISNTLKKIFKIVGISSAGDSFLPTLAKCLSISDLRYNHDDIFATLTSLVDQPLVLPVINLRVF